MLNELGRLTGETILDDEVRVVIVTGTGERAFCAGTDVSNLGRSEEEATAASREREQERAEMNLPDSHHPCRNRTTRRGNPGKCSYKAHPANISLSYRRAGWMFLTTIPKNCLSASITLPDSSVNGKSQIRQSSRRSHPDSIDGPVQLTFQQQILRWSAPLATLAR